MKLSKLYTNRPEDFSPVEFVDGLNVILAEIRLRNNTEKDLHNIGKTKFGAILDYCLLASADEGVFLLERKDIFLDFVFFLEINLLDGTYLTVRRGVKDATKISLKKHALPGQDFSVLADREWDHLLLPFEKAKTLLDGLLNFESIKPWGFRKAVNYLLRSQDDYTDVYRLQKFQGKQSDWKPYLAQLLGFDAQLVGELYQKESESDAKRQEEKTISQELQGTLDDASKISGMILIKQEKVSKTQRFLDSLDFRSLDKEKTRELVNEIDDEIAELNARRYSLTLSRKKIQTSLRDDQILFDSEEARRIFDEVGILFKDQIKKDFDQLVAFNVAISEERRDYLLEEKNEIDSSLKEIGARLNELGKRRIENLSFITGADVFSKYRKGSDELVDLKADIESLLRKRDFIHRLQDLRGRIRELDDEKGQIQTLIERNVDEQHMATDSLFSTILRYFNEIVHDVISASALIDVTANSLGHLDFKAEILDETESYSNAQDGHTYRKLLCIAFDMAVLRAYLNVPFPRFVYHDGVLESLDPRKKMNLINVMRRYSELGIQQIVTIIEPDLAGIDDEGNIILEDDEIIIRLHDDGNAGRLFKFKSW